MRETDGGAGGMFKLELFLPEDYPMAPPKVRFITNIYHPNVDKLGAVLPIVLRWQADWTKIFLAQGEYAWIF